MCVGSLAIEDGSACPFAARLSLTHERRALSVGSKFRYMIEGVYWLLYELDESLYSGFTVLC